MNIPLGYAQINLIFTGSSVPEGAQMTFGLDHTGSALSPTGIAEVVEAAWISSGIKSRYVSSLGLTGILVKEGPNVTGASALLGVVHNGTASGTSVAPNTSVLIRKHTAIGGRAGRGRCYFPGIPEADVDGGGLIVSTERALWETDFQTFLDDIAAESLIPVLLHGDNSPVSTPTPITGVTVDSKVATQRRRLRR